MSSRGRGGGGGETPEWAPLAAGVVVGVGILALVYKFFLSSKCVKEPKTRYTCTYRPIYTPCQKENLRQEVAEMECCEEEEPKKAVQKEEVQKEEVQNDENVCD